MSVHTVVQKAGMYFITFTCHDWLPLIDRSDGYAAVYRFFGVLKQKGCILSAYVIMPNHLHLLVHYTGKPKTSTSWLAMASSLWLTRCCAR